MDILLDETERCGEIYLSNNGILFFICSLCDQNCKDYKEYLSHITNGHNLQFCFWDDIQNPIDMEEQTEYIDYEELLEDVDEFCMQEDETTTIITRTEYVATPNETSLVAKDDFLRLIEEPATIKKDLEISDDEEINPKETIVESIKLKEECEQQRALKDSNYSNFKCPHCSKVIKSKGNFDKHVLRHSDQNKRYPCKIEGCTKRFFQRFELIQHERSHTGERPYICSDCGLRFITGGKLNAHISKVHKNERKKVCNVCNKAFFNNNFLRSHMAVHTQERNHICATCNVSFKRRKTLVAHMKLHENRLEHKCDKCDARFNQRPALKAHIKKQHS